MEFLVLGIVFLVFAAVMSMMILSPFIALTVILWNAIHGIGKIFHHGAPVHKHQ